MNVVGIDVGGTNTDAVLMGDGRVLATFKNPTTPDVTAGIIGAVSGLIRSAGEAVRDVHAVMVGTTHFTNAVVQGSGLEPVVAVRIGLPATAFLEPFVDWPDRLAAKVCAGVFMLEGGHEYDGRPLVPFDRDGMKAVAGQIAEAGLRSVAITSVFSPLSAECEELAEEILLGVCPEIDVTLSHRLGRIGLLPRENVALLNASLRPLARMTVDAYVRAFSASGLKAPLFITQNDGTVMTAEFGKRYPVYCFASGPTNSMRGAAYLSGLKDAIVVDVGGTTTDIGFLRSGFPREANSAVEIGGVRSLFRMPDLISLPLGGGTIVHGNPFRLGPESVGYDLSTRAVLFGGADITCTDVAVAEGLLRLGDPVNVARLDASLRADSVAAIRTMLEQAVDRMKPDAGDVPLVAVGGGAFLVPDEMPGISEVLTVDHHDVANAVGAAIAQVSGEIDRVFQNLDREVAIARAVSMAEERALEAGAQASSLETVEIEDLPMAYLPGNSLRVRAKVVGDIAPQPEAARRLPDQ